MQVIIQTLISLGLKLITSTVIEKVVLLSLKELSKKTDNQVDDEIVKIVEEALKPVSIEPQEPPPSSR
jgi:hypothetical protein